MSAIIRLSSVDGDDGDNGSSWALAKATLAGAIAALSAGDIILVDKNHTETLVANTTLTFPGTAAAPNLIICVDRTQGETPTVVDTGASIKTSGAYYLALLGHFYAYGVTLSTGDGATAGADLNLAYDGAAVEQVYDHCTLQSLTNYSSARMNVGSSSGKHNKVVFLDCTVKFSNAGGRILPRSVFVWRGGTLNVATAIPAALLISGGINASVEIAGVDLSGLNTAILAPQAVGGAKVKVRNCKTHASLAKTSAAITAAMESVEMDNCGSGDTNYKMDHGKYQGSIAIETTIKRTGGASDGTTGFSWKMVSLTPNFVWPLETAALFRWNDTSGSGKTVTVEILHDSVTNLTDEDVWVEVEYAGTSGYPQAVVASDRKASALAAAADQTASSETWTTTGLTNPNTQKLSVTFTPQQKGVYIIKVMLAKASKTIYVCPKVSVA